MKKTISHSLLYRGVFVCISILISIAIFLCAFETISFLRFKQSFPANVVSGTISEPNSVEKNNTGKELNYDLTQYHDFIECMKGDINSDAHCDDIQEVANSPVLSDAAVNNAFYSYNFFADLKDCNVLIKLVYLCLLFTLTQQVYILLCRLAGGELSDRIYYRSEWSINCAPMLGLLGTFFSLAVMLTGNESSNVGNKLLENFFDAVMTSMVGIIFYVICFYLKIYIYSEDKNEA